MRPILAVIVPFLLVLMLSPLEASANGYCDAVSLTITDYSKSWRLCPIAECPQEETWVTVSTAYFTCIENGWACDALPCLKRYYINATVTQCEGCDYIMLEDTTWIVCYICYDHPDAGDPGPIFPIPSQPL